MYDFLVGRFLSLSCGRPPTGQKERIVLDSIERSVGYGAICEEMSSLSLLLRSFSRLGRDSYLMLLSYWMLDSLAELLILDAEPEQS